MGGVHESSVTILEFDQKCSALDSDFLSTCCEVSAVDVNLTVFISKFWMEVDRGVGPRAIIALGLTRKPSTAADSKIP